MNTGMNPAPRPDAFVLWFGFRLEVWLLDGRAVLLAGLWPLPGGSA